MTEEPLIILIEYDEILDMWFTTYQDLESKCYLGSSGATEEDALDNILDLFDRYNDDQEDKEDLTPKQNTDYGK